MVPEVVNAALESIQEEATVVQIVQAVGTNPVSAGTMAGRAPGLVVEKNRMSKSANNVIDENARGQAQSNKTPVGDALPLPYLDLPARYFNRFVHGKGVKVNGDENNTPRLAISLLKIMYTVTVSLDISIHFSSFCFM